MADRITYVGLDVHKESIAVAVASDGLRGEVRQYGRVANTARALDRLDPSNNRFLGGGLGGVAGGRYHFWRDRRCSRPAWLVSSSALTRSAVMQERFAH
jgi:hypothetical protein